VIFKGSAWAEAGNLVNFRADDDLIKTQASHGGFVSQA
jgi:hypothetical protein